MTATLPTDLFSVGAWCLDSAVVVSRRTAVVHLPRPAAPAWQSGTALWTEAACSRPPRPSVGALTPYRRALPRLHAKRGKWRACRWCFTPTGRPRRKHRGPGGWLSYPKRRDGRQLPLLQEIP